jgi:signal recognition particle receptor subunit beta
MPRRADLAFRTHDVEGRSGRSFKIVVTGPFSAGKTTLIKSVSDLAVVGTERGVTDHTSAVKQHTTVAMDFGRITFADDFSLYIFGTPGQRRFEVVWEVLSEGMLGFVLLVKWGEADALEEAIHILEIFERYADVPFVVGVTHLDRSDEPPEAVLPRVRTTLGVADDIPVLACDPRLKEDGKALLLNVLFGVQRRLERVDERERRGA